MPFTDALADPASSALPVPMSYQMFAITPSVLSSPDTSTSRVHPVPPQPPSTEVYSTPDSASCRYDTSTSGRNEKML